MARIEEIKTMDIHIEFEGDGRFRYNFNNDEGIEAEIPLEQVRIIARTLSRIAVEMWGFVDNAYLEIERKTKID